MGHGARVPEGHGVRGPVGHGARGVVISLWLFVALAPLHSSPQITVLPAARSFAAALAADFRGFCKYIAANEQGVKHTADHREVKDAALLLGLARDEGHAVASSRVDAILGLARNGVNIVELAQLNPRQTVDDPLPVIRSAVAEAIGLSFDDLQRDPVYGPSPVAPWNPADFAEPARGLIETRLRTETDPNVAAAWLRAAARLPLDLARAGAVEVTLTSNLRGPLKRVIGAVTGLEILARRAPARALGLDATSRLRQFAEGNTNELLVDRPSNERERAIVSEDLALLARLSLLTLHESGNDSDDTLERASTSGDWQVRRMAAMYLKPIDDRNALALERLLGDAQFQVRAAAVTSLAPRMRVTMSCAKLMALLDDESAPVVMAVLDAAPTNCSENDELERWVRQRVQELITNRQVWHIGVRALARLVRLRDRSAQTLNVAAAAHWASEVRMAAADFAASLDDEPTAFRLASDIDLSVRAAAMTSLTTLKSRRRGVPALDNLRGLNGSLALAAARAIPDGMPTEDLRVAFERALKMWTTRGVNARAVRVGLIERVGALHVGEMSYLRDLLRDADPAVAKAAADAIFTLTGDQPLSEPRLIAPLQRPESLLRRLPRTAVIRTSQGEITLELLVDEAPMAVAQFVSSAFSYSGLKFSDVAPGLAARIGDNPFDSPFSEPTRDELGATRHARGTLAMVSNGYDLQNGLFFINLIDRPDLDHGYTVFARIVNGIERADRLMPGERVSNTVGEFQPIR